ncbi:YtxH domain-containing protein [Fibrella aquatica]|uniref:YtxH domain-containing protein n=1 Tax=Fibrella aquatica TaxID=3242487 RepID=UPI00352066C3
MKSLPGILLGIAAGVIVGVLLAPKSGKETREGLASDTDNFFSDLQDQLQDGLESIRKQYSEYVETAADKTKSVAADAKRRANF